MCLDLSGFLGAVKLIERIKITENQEFTMENLEQKSFIFRYFDQFKTPV
jgi:hypothetical protein